MEAAVQRGDQDPAATLLGARPIQAAVQPVQSQTLRPDRRPNHRPGSRVVDRRAGDEMEGGVLKLVLEEKAVGRTPVLC